jgi:uncharacterized protein
MSKTFWQDGLRFECTKCSACCRHDPGFVFLSAVDLRKLLDYSGLHLQVFLQMYVKKVDTGSGFWLSLREKPNNDCILWDSNGCTMYDARPIQCSTYPFWDGVIESNTVWSRESLDCPGIDRGSIIVASDILERLQMNRSNIRINLAYDVVLESIDEDTLLGFTRLTSNTTYPGKITE